MIEVKYSDADDPNARGVTFVGINFDSHPYVWATYSCRDRDNVPESVRDSDNILVVSREKAFFRYSFVKH